MGKGNAKCVRHGYSKHCTWGKLHLGTDESTGASFWRRSPVPTTINDDEAFDALLDGAWRRKIEVFWQMALTTSASVVTP